MSRLIPPLKRDWNPGEWQIGIFVRTPDGDVIEWVQQKSSEATWKKILRIIRLTK